MYAKKRLFLLRRAVQEDSSLKGISHVLFFCAIEMFLLVIHAKSALANSESSPDPGRTGSSGPMSGLKRRRITWNKKGGKEEGKKRKADS